MNTNQGISESLPGQKGEPKDSPFTVVGESPAQSPFTALEKPASPFAVADDTSKPVKLPEPRKAESPFKVEDPPEGFGFEAPAAGASPFSPKPAVAEPTASPFSRSPQFPAPASQAVSASASSIPQEFTAAPHHSKNSGSFLSDSSSIRQLELRAIFGVDHELNADEILQRARSLSGIRSLVRVEAKELATIAGLKNLLPSLGFGSGPLKLYAGNVPIDFIREGAVVLAVQAEGAFAPGVRETLMIVARELGRLG